MELPPAGLTSQIETMDFERLSRKHMMLLLNALEFTLLQVTTG